MGSTFRPAEAVSLRIRNSIDFFYPPFRRYFSRQFFRYGVTGSANLLFDWALYYVLYNFVLQQRMLRLGFVTLSSHIASLAIKIPIVFLTGFFLQKYVTFSASDLRGRVQLFRYLVVFFINLAISYVGLKLMVDGLGLYPTLSNMLVSAFTVIVSFFLQKQYTFRTRNTAQDRS
jgi:putative flippase GtrA